MLELDQLTAWLLLDWLSTRRDQVEACDHLSTFTQVFAFLEETQHPAGATLITWLEGQDLECDCEVLAFLEEFIA